jgi:hypothetical protein
MLDPTTASSRRSRPVAYPAYLVFRNGIEFERLEPLIDWRTDGRIRKKIEASLEAETP